MKISVIIRGIRETKETFLSSITFVLILICVSENLNSKHNFVNQFSYCYEKTNIYEMNFNEIILRIDVMTDEE